MNQAHNETLILSLPLDIRLIIYEHLQIKDMHSLIRSCKFYLHSCNRYIRSLLCIKFKYLLSQNKGKVKIKHLINIPFVDSIIVDSVNFPRWFGKNNGSKIPSSKYIGVDRKSGNAFISFLMKRVDINLHEWKIITVLFNETGIDGIYLSDSSGWSYLTVARKLRPLNDNASIADRSRAVEQILLNGKIQCDDLWCLDDQWESCMLWPRVRANFRNIRVKAQAAFRQKLESAAVVSLILIALIFWVALILALFQYMFNVKVMH